MRGTFVLFALLMASGCVSKAKYAEMEDMYGQAAKDRDQLSANLDKAKDARDRSISRDDKQLKAFALLFKDMMVIHDQGLAKVSIVDGRAVLGLESDVLFASGSAEVTAAGKKSIAAIAKVLAKGDARFQVEGHTDNDPISTDAFPNNWHLGADRALNVATAMVAAGMPASRVSAATYGDTIPVASNTDASGKAQNRRIEIVLMPELASFLPYGKIMEEIKKKGGKAQRSKSNRMEAEATDE
jgi:chemotaxis protein MotB